MQLSKKGQTTTTTTTTVQQVVTKKVTTNESFKGYRNCAISYDERIDTWRDIQFKCR